MTVTVTLESNGFFLGIEYVAVFCCGLLGGLAAIRKHYDLFAIVLTITCINLLVSRKHVHY